MALISENEKGNNVVQNVWIKRILNYMHDYDHVKYWKRRDIIVNPNNKTSKLKKLYLLYLLKKNDIKHHSSFGTDLNKGSKFKSPPNLPHGPYGIIVGMDCTIGENVTIYHQVTIMHGNVEIGNNVMLGAGSKILPNVKIGNNVKVGANCVVVEDIPEGATVVLNKPRILYGK